MRRVGGHATTFSLADLMECNKTLIWLDLKEVDTTFLERIFKEENKGRDDFDQGGRRLGSCHSQFFILKDCNFRYVVVYLDQGTFVSYDMFVILIACWRFELHVTK